MVAASPGSSLIAQSEYIRRLLNRIESLEDEREILKETITILQQEKRELERAGVGRAVPDGEGGHKPDHASDNNVHPVGVGNTGGDGDSIVIQRLIRNAAPGPEQNQFVDLKVHLKVHGKEVHVWKKVLRLMRLSRQSGLDLDCYVSGVKLEDIKEEGDSD